MANKESRTATETAPVGPLPGAPAPEAPAIPAPAPGGPQAPVGEMKTYYGGLTEACPFDYITVPTIPGEGAFTLAKYTQRLQDDGKGVFSLTGRERGGILRLFDDEYALILKYVRTRRVYWESRGENKRVVIIPQEGPGAKRSRRDETEGRVESLAKYVFLVPAKSVTAEGQAEGFRFPTLDQPGT